MRRTFCVWLPTLACLVAIPAMAADPNDSQPAFMPQQIEADWLRQDELRQMPAAQSATASVQEDAAGGVDGVINGKWGFHTENEPQPWWQVDLGEPVALDRVVLYNRTDLAERNAKLMLLLSDDGNNFRQVWQNDGTIFLGHSDKKPLEVKLGGERGRYLRLQLPGKSYFHLDEVQVYAVGKDKNVALNRPATQSSVSQWSARHATSAGEAKSYAIATVLERGRKLAGVLRSMGVAIDDQAAILNGVEAKFKSLPKDAPADAQRELYLQAHWAVRRMSLRNPLLDFDAILFVKRAPTMFPHVSDQHYGWFSRPGGGIYRLEGLKSGNPQVRCLTADMPTGNFAGPDISFDGRKVLFAYCRHYPHLADVQNKVDKESLPEDSFYHIFEMNVDGTDRRQLTRGRYDDFDPRYLPDGGFVFLSTRKGTAIQCSRASTAATEQGTCPDSYVRCGGGSHRPVAVFTLHAADSDGASIRPISAFENFEWTPALAHDGRVLYARWDYIDRFNGPFFSLWSTNPDGTGSQLVYGNYTVRPQCVFEARPVPGSQKLVFTATAHHSITGGSLCLLDRTRGTEFLDPLTRLTPEVVFPETEGWPEHYYINPYPLSEQFYLVAWADRRLPAHTICTDDRNPVNSAGIYLFDALGNLELLHRDPAITSQHPLPIAARPRPASLPNHVDWSAPQEGRFLVQDVYRGLEGIPRGSVKRLRIVAVPPKVQPQMNSPVLGVSAEDPGKYVLGTVPVEDDGSAYFRVPSGVPVLFQALDERGLTVQTMRSLAYVMPQQTQSCVGCHEHRDSAPPSGGMPLAMSKEPAKLTPGPAGSWPLRYDQLVQPVLDRACVSCHRPGSDDAKAARLDLTAAKSYQSLLSFGGEDLKKKAFERDQSIPGQCTAMQSKLYAILSDEKGHEGLKLDAASLERIVLWMDVYAHRQGSFSEAQERELEQMRKAWSDLLAEQPGRTHHAPP